VDLFLGIKEGGKVMGDANSAINMHSYHYISVYKLEIDSSASKKNNSKGCAGHHSTENKLIIKQRLL